METNNAPFYVGQRVVCLKTGQEIKKGKEYTIQDCFPCFKCGCWHITLLEIPDPADYPYHCFECTGLAIKSTDYAGGPAKYFAPIQPAYESATEEILSKFQPTDETADKVLKPTQVERF